MILMVVDGQGGGIGATIIKRLRGIIGHELEILAFGTNSIATSQMLKAGANRGATGENAIVRSMPIRLPPKAVERRFRHSCDTPGCSHAPSYSPA